ncbi:DUF4407 domain-containing protein [Streptosporangium sp. NBC_01469]|uniref:DUF4407 domain-containing protein n=1 Tax=Streptosporangium sp. NBC_01469 TaxID=2903898 RepID=UPI002E2E15BB|nr:DUF4407 domain-containing protein [Streptosporangium sp. NBC_01469]
MTDEVPPGRHSKVPPAEPGSRFDLGRRLRVLSGVDEEILDQVPLERTRYVGLGGVVLGTAVVAGISMWFALSQVLGGSHIGLVIPTVIWTLIVLNLDRWLVSTVTGIWQRRLLMLVPRLLVAVVLGFVIAEPLVLKVFETAVVQHVLDERQDARGAERALLLRCNPQEPGDAREQRGCEDARLLAPAAESDATRLRDLERDAERLRTRVNADSARYDRLFTQATNECGGKKTEGTSGRRGMGPLCERLDTAVKAFAARSKLAENQKRLRSLDDQVSALREPLADKRADFGQRVEADVQKRVDAMPGADDPVGLLERMRALHELTAENPYLFGASWLLRLFLILIDCLPVLVKLMGGTTAYDRMVDRANRTQERIHERRLQFSADGRVGELELQAHRDAEDRRRRRQLMDIESKAADAEARAAVEAMIRRRTEEMSFQGVTHVIKEERRNGSHPHIDLTSSQN